MMTTAEPVPQDVVDGLRRLRLATIREQAAEVLQTARTQRWPPEDVLRTLIAAEIAGRDQANRKIRLKQACFPATKTLDSFDFDVVPMLSKARVLAICAGDPPSRLGALTGPDPVPSPEEPEPESASSITTIIGKTSRMRSASSGYLSVYSLSAGRSPRR